MPVHRTPTKGKKGQEPTKQTDPLQSNTQSVQNQELRLVTGDEPVVPSRTRGRPRKSRVTTTLRHTEPADGTPAGSSSSDVVEKDPVELSRQIDEAAVIILGTTRTELVPLGAEILSVDGAMELRERVTAGAQERKDSTRTVDTIKPISTIIRSSADGSKLNMILSSPTATAQFAGTGLASVSKNIIPRLRSLNNYSTHLLQF